MASVDAKDSKLLQEVRKIMAAQPRVPQRTLLLIVVGVILVLLIVVAIIFWPRGPKDVGGVPTETPLPIETPVPTRDPLILALATAQAEQSAAIAALATQVGQPTPTPIPTATPVATVAPSATPAPSGPTPTPVAIDWDAIGQGLMAWLEKQGVPMKPAVVAPASPAPATVQPASTPTPIPVTAGAAENETLVQAALALWPKTESGAKTFFDGGMCPAGEECRELEDWELQVDLDDDGSVAAVYVRRELLVEGEWHDIMPFPCRNPLSWPLYGQLGRPSEREVLGLTRDECVAMGIDPDNDGSMIPAQYGLDGQGLCNGFSAYPLDAGSRWHKIKAWTVDERRVAFEMAGGEPWATAGWIATHFSLGDDCKVEHIRGKSWRIKPSVEGGVCYLCNPDDVGYDGWRAEECEPARPGVEESKAKRSGVPKNWCGRVQGASLWPGGSW